MTTAARGPIGLASATGGLAGDGSLRGSCDSALRPPSRLAGRRRYRAAGASAGSVIRYPAPGSVKSS
jgi:hypothetical protein